MKKNPWCPQCGYSKRVIASHKRAHELNMFDFPRCYKPKEFDAWAEQNQTYVYQCNRCNIDFKSKMQEA